MDKTLQEAEDLRARVNRFLGSHDVLQGNFLAQNSARELMQPTADWSGLAKWMLKRVRDCNALGGPHMHVVPWQAFATEGRLPKYPEPVDCRYILDAQRLLEEWVIRQDKQGRVDGRIICFSFFSHCWERPSVNPEEAHPDTACGKKAQVLKSYGFFGTRPDFSPTWAFEYFFWIDYAGINQCDRREKMLGISKVSAWAAASTEVIVYNSSTVDYEPHAWTRLERMWGFTHCPSPSCVYLDDDYPNFPINVQGTAADNPDLFVVDPKTGALMVRLRDPAGDGASPLDAGDSPLVGGLTDTVRAAQATNPLRIWAGPQDPFAGSPCMRLSTEHYSMDVKTTMQRNAMQKLVEQDFAQRSRTSQNSSKKKTVLGSESSTRGTPCCSTCESDNSFLPGSVHEKQAVEQHGVQGERTQSKDQQKNDTWNSGLPTSRKQSL